MNFTFSFFDAFLRQSCSSLPFNDPGRGVGSQQRKGGDRASLYFIPNRRCYIQGSGDSKRISKLSLIQLLLPFKISCIRVSLEIPLLSLTRLPLSLITTRQG